MESEQDLKYQQLPDIRVLLEEFKFKIDLDRANMATGEFNGAKKMLF